MAAVKRKRDPVFQANEKSLLLDLIQEHWDIIECKKTDGLNKRAKAAIWEIICTKFNAATSHIRRDTVALRNLWENMKKGAKGIITLRNHNRLTTGGGPPKHDKEDPIMDKVISLIAPTAQGFNNPYDDDALVANARPLELKGPGADCVADDSTLTVEEAIDWSSYTPEMLRTPISKVLKYQAVEDTVEIFDVVQDILPEHGQEYEHHESPLNTETLNTPVGVPKKFAVPRVAIMASDEVVSPAAVRTSVPSSSITNEKIISSRRRPVLKQSNADLLTKIKAKTLHTCNEQATLQHNITMEILNIQKKQELEKLKQEELRTEILQIELQIIKKE